MLADEGDRRYPAARSFRWRDKDFSFTDCSSFVIMKERRIKAALTSDRHFAQARFQVHPAA